MGHMSKVIKHKIRDGLIFLISVSGLSFVYRRHTRHKEPLVRVLCFHDVPEREWFESVITILKQNYHLLTPTEFHEKKFDPNRINILLTFDDGYQSWVDVALPVLDTHNVKGLFFICSGLLDVYGTEAQKDFVKKRLLLKPRKTLSWEGAQKLVSAGHAIGGHTVSHRNLAKLSKKHPERVWSEIKDNKVALEHKLKTKVMDFAYPFGRQKHFNEDVTAEVQKAMYSHIYSAETGFVDASANINRTLVEKNQSLKSIQRWIDGAYDIFCLSKNRLN